MVEAGQFVQDRSGKLLRMRAGAAAAKAAKVGIAFVVSPAAGVREAGVALVDTLVKSDPEMKVALNQVTAELGSP